MGFFDDMFGGIFDFNGDGKTTWDEELLAYMILDNNKKESKTSNSSRCPPLFDDNDSIENDSNSRHDFCVDGSQLDVEPEDCETEEYDVALEEANYVWREYCEDGSEFNVNPEDYETEEEYDVALEEAKYIWREYCEDGSEFNVNPEDYETEEEYDAALEEAKYALPEYCEDGSEFDTEPEDYETEEAKNEVSEFYKDASETIFNTLQCGLTDVAKTFFEAVLINAGKDTDSLIRLIKDVTLRCKNFDELETMERFQLDLFPLVLIYASDEFKKEIDSLQKEMSDCIREAERNNKKYAFSRCNSWRKTAPDGKKYGLDVCCYDREQEYLDELYEKKYGWRSNYNKDDCFGLDPYDYETMREFDAVLKKRAVKAQKIESEQQRMEQNEKATARSITPPVEFDRTVFNDKNIYTYCGVVFSRSNHIYFYRTDDNTLKVGDTVIVPVGKYLNQNEATIVSVGQYARVAVPFPVEKALFIIKKIEEKK